MKPSATIDLFIQLAKLYVRRNGLLIIPRRDTLAFLNETGTTIKDVIHIIKHLDPSMCFDGPEADRDQRRADAWTVAEFSPTWRRKKLYLKISINLSTKRCKCLSIKPYQEHRK